MSSIWTHYSSFYSSQTVQKILVNQYQKINIPSPEQKAFQNSYPFMYYLMHAENHFKTANQSPFAVQPTLAFYGLCQLMKAAILTVDPDYPSHSSLLAHGVSSRKRKKQNYQFLDDEIKIQKNGLFGHVAQCLFHMKHVEGDKYSMQQLLRKLPEQEEVFKQNLEIETMYRISKEMDSLHIHKELADFYFVSPNRLKEIVENKLNLICKKEQENSYIFEAPTYFDIVWNSKLAWNFFNNQLYLPTNKDDLRAVPEVLIHYLLLYNLSMISRYETEWWYDLLFSHTSYDYIFIYQFIHASLLKIPFIFYQFFESIFFTQNKTWEL
ncbi:YaaC family protein [Bacillus sp. FJAT-47783]|uniref:YaaC family protein n=1 Tax=Bacillus sp. FJAT-47783 TaxID=2922712 RepID=UPI001FAE5AAD|nr:YaaC family protein [Bacillus sp. FJAT-47783]